MDKCATCVFKNVDGICQKYNKPIVASVELLGIDNPRKYQKESIRLANSSDSERTASLFANNYDQNEFSLTTNDELEIDDEQTPQALADVLFGGFEQEFLDFFLNSVFHSKKFHPLRFLSFFPKLDLNEQVLLQLLLLQEESLAMSDHSWKQICNLQSHIQWSRRHF